MTDVSLVDLALDMTYVSDRATNEQLRRLVGSLDLSYDNIAVRWAIVRSIAEGPAEGLDDALDSEGKELKGKTLFGGVDSASLLLGQLVLIEGADRVGDDLRALVLAHWRRGQALLDRELAEAEGEGDVLVRRSLDRVQPRRRSAEVRLDEVTGQPTVVDRLAELLDKAHLDRAPDAPPTLGAPVAVLGRAGSGKTYIANALARRLEVEVVTIQGSTAKTLRELKAVASHAVAHGPGAALVVEDVDVLPAPVLRVLADAARSGTLPLGKDTVLRGVSVIGTAHPSASLRNWTKVAIEPYERDDVAAIIRTRYGWHLEVRRTIALAGRLRPKQALARSVDLAARVTGPRVSDRHVADAMADWDLERLGLDRTDRDVLAAVIGNHPAEEGTLAGRLDLDPAHLRDEVLSYLHELGLVEEGPSRMWRPTTAGLETYG